VTFIDEEDLKEPWKKVATASRKLTGPLPSVLTAMLSNLIYFEKEALPQALANRLIRLAAFQNPEYFKAQAMRFSVWDVPRVIGCAENFPNHIGLPRGCLDAAKELLRDNGIQCEVVDERSNGSPLELTFTCKLRADQEAAVKEVDKHDAGVLCAPTAFGKTVTAAALIAKRGVSTLILVHRTELLKQWQERLQAFLTLDKGYVGVIGGGKSKPTGKIDIAVMQSLSRQGEVNPIVESYGQVIIDECHHVGAVSFDAILKRVKAKYVLGLTATPIRRDGQQPIIFMQCGPIRHSAARPLSAPQDLEVVPRYRERRIETVQDEGIQDGHYTALTPTREAAMPKSLFPFRLLYLAMLLGGADLRAAVPHALAAQTGAAQGSQAAPPALMLAQNWQSTLHPADFLVSEKLDGVRAYWDGKALRFRSGRLIAPPPWFTAALPDMPLDGELWMGRGSFDRLSGAVRKAIPVDSEWRGVRYMIFDMPGAPGAFSERVDRIRAVVADASVSWLQVVEQFRVLDDRALPRLLQATVQDGGEGLVLHRAGALWKPGRSEALRKLKAQPDEDARVVAQIPGKGRHSGRMGALRLEMANGTQFTLGTGFTDAQRAAPAAIGMTVTYRYRDRTPSGVPKFASFLRVRADE
jgi:hypothetical protein